MGETRVSLIASRTLSLSLVIPTCGRTITIAGAEKFLLLELLDSLSDELNAIKEVVVIADDHTPTQLTAALRLRPNVIVVPFGEPFNFSKKCNVGARRASGDVVMFLNDDMLAISTHWVKEVQKYLADEEVGAVGGLLLTPTGLVQCAGHSNKPWPHMYGVGLDPTDPTFHARLMEPRTCDGLSGACFAVRRSDYMLVGGMCEEFPNSYNDVDLGFKIQTLEKRLMYVPSIRFVHYESISRNPIVGEAETELLWRRWARFFDSVPYAP